MRWNERRSKAAGRNRAILSPNDAMKLMVEASAPIVEARKLMVEASAPPVEARKLNIVEARTHIATAT